MFYRNAVLRVVTEPSSATSIYTKKMSSRFYRPPFVATLAGLPPYSSFALTSVVVHTQPTAAEQEVAALATVARQLLGDTALAAANGGCLVVMGDFNAGT